MSGLAIQMVWDAEWVVENGKGWDDAWQGSRVEADAPAWM
jgi:hypothetical protein